MRDMKTHAVADIFPMKNAAEYAALKADIAANGLREPLKLTRDGQLIDGRNRLKACKELGIEPMFQHTDEDPKTLAIAANLMGKQLTGEARVAILLELGYSADQARAMVDISDVKFNNLITLVKEGGDTTAIKENKMIASVALRQLRAQRGLDQPASRAWVAPKTKKNVMRARSAKRGDGVDHLIIPDTQVQPGVPLVHLRWIAQYVAEKQPQRIVHLGDHFDMKSLSSYDKGTIKAEGKRVRCDLAAGIVAMRIFRDTLAQHAPPSYKPEQHMLTGNHEERLMRHVENNPELDGQLSYADMQREEHGWTTHDFLEPVDLDGVRYCHYFVRNTHGAVVQSKRGMPSAREQVKREGLTCIAGHKQGLDVHVQGYQDRQQWGVIAGSCYLHDEGYLTAQGTCYWRGIIVLKNVHAGNFAPWFIDLDYLCRRYEGKDLETFLKGAADSELLIADV